MLDLDLELDCTVNNVETEWRRAHEACMAARADYDRVLDGCKANGGLIDVARIRLERAEALRARLLAKMERLEERIAGETQG
jgi:hypothetical protein